MSDVKSDDRENREDQTLRYYSQNAASYAARSTACFEKDPIQEFSRLIPAGGRVLDAGFGAGNHLAFLLAQGFECEGFDGAEQLLKIAQEKLKPASPKLWRADFRFLGLYKSYYEGIWANRVFVHLPPVVCQRVMQNFFSALRSGGILFASFEDTEPSEGTEPNSAVGQYQDRFDNLEGPFRHFYRYPAPEFESLVRQSGFHPLSVGRDLKNPGRMAILARRI